MILQRNALTGLLVALPLLFTGTTGEAAETASKKNTSIPARPEQLSFPSLNFEVPPGDSFLHKLNGSIPAFVVENRSLPLVKVSVRLRSGGYLDPADKPGLAALTGSLVRRGGTTSKTAEELDEELEFLAANISTGGFEDNSTANLNCISQALDSCLSLFFEMLREPAFQESRLEVERARLLEALKQRNDDAGDILQREWRWQLFGEDFFASREPTADQLKSITRKDLQDFHRRTWQPQEMIFAISGDIDTKEVLTKIETHLKDWPSASGNPTPWPPSLPTKQPKPGLYYVDKDIPQGKVHIGHLMPQLTNWDDPDLPAIRVMNEILGAGGFSSRIVKRIRSDEGLAYSAGSNYNIQPFWPSSFIISFQSKSSTVALATKIALEEIERIKREPVSPTELETAKNSLIQSFPRRFESASQIANTYAFDAFIDRSHDFWQDWRASMAAVTATEVQRVAQKYLDQSQFLMVVVGNWSDIAPGDADGRAKMKELFDGQAQALPLRDPLTLQPLP